MTAPVALPSASRAQSDDDSTLAVPGLHWDEAAWALLNAVGYGDDISAAKSLNELSRLLRGSGFDLVRTGVINGIVPTTEDMAGCLIAQSNGYWLAVLGAGEGAVVLSAAGEKTAPFITMDVQNALDAWVLRENLIDISSVTPFLKRYRHYFGDLFLAAVLVNIFALVLPLFSSFVYDKILGNGIFETLWALTIGILIAAGIEFCVRIVRIAVAERFAVVSEIEIDHATFRNLMDSDVNAMPTFGSLLEKYKQILSFRDFLSSSYLLAVADLPFLLLFLIAIAVVAGPLVFVPLGCGGLMLLASFAFTTPVLIYDRHARAAGEKRFSLMTDVLNSRDAVIGSALRNTMTERWRQVSVTAVKAASQARYWRGFGMTLAGSISTLSFMSILVGGVYLVEDHHLTSGGLLAASMLTSRTMAGFASVITLLLRYREFRTALRELNHILPEKKSHAQTRSHGLLHGAVRFDKVTCRLREGDAPVLDRISLAIQPGEIVGIAGAPGAGKTTLLRLLTGALKVDEGRILIDNIPLEHLSHEDIARNIGFKPQDCCLLDGSIEYNVRAGRSPLTAELRREILVVSGLFRVFEEGSAHWETEVGVRGTRLSGGQRQMVALARAFLGQPPLLLLDEPTNGLDAPLEAHLATQIARLRGRSTVLVSSHCRNILNICDRIIVVGQSRILADGPRDKILG